jgi:phosphoglycolate phosphatase
MVVFDLDGTLIDSAQDLALSVSEMVQAFGAPPLTHDEVVAMVGEGAPVLVARALARVGLPPDTPGALERFLAIYDRRLLDHTAPYDGIHEVLAILLSTGPLAVLTNKPTAPNETLLRQLGLRGYFSAVIGGDGPYPPKPHPDGLRALMQQAPGPTVMVGDLPADFRTAAAAGCPFVLAAYGFGGSQIVGQLPAGSWVAAHPRDLVSIADTRTFDAARIPIVMR